MHSSTELQPAKRNGIETKPNSTTGYAPVKGLNMYYEIHGSGKPLVLIHGGGSTIQTSFGNIIPLLLPYYKIIAVELQAHGHTTDRDSAESFEQDADDVAALLQYIHISKAHVMGFSNGGNTALQLAMRHPALVDKLVAVSAFYKREGMIPGFFEGMAKATLENMPAALKDHYLEIAGNNKEGLQVMFEKDRDRMLYFKDWTDEKLQAVKAQVLVIAGNQDVVTAEHSVKMSHIIPDARLIILPGTHGSFIGEICTAEKGSKIPEMTVAMISQFLDK